MPENNKLAIVMLRSLINTKPDIKNTFKVLGLERKNGCIVVEDNPSVRKMLFIVKDYATWGEISPETLKKLEAKKEEGKKIIKLSSPKKGYGGIKVPFRRGGGLGYRKDKINELLERMM